MAERRENADPNQPLIFDWRESRRSRHLPLFFVLVVAFAMHALMFYVFRVSYPASDRPAPTPWSITFPNSDDPDIREKLLALEDRAATIDPTVNATSPLVLENYFDVFVPSFSGELELRKLPAEKPSLDLPPLISTDAVVLPKVESAPFQIVPPAIQEIVPEMRLSGGLRNRKMTLAPSWPQDYLSKQPAGARAIFLVRVLPSGAVEDCELESTSAAEEIKPLRNALRGARFEPIEAGSISFGKLEIIW